MRLIPSSLFGRLTLILLAGLLASQVASLWLHRGERAALLYHAQGQRAAERVADAVKVLEATSPENRPAALVALQASDFHVAFISRDEVATTLPPGPMAALLDGLLRKPRDVRMVAMPLADPGQPELGGVRTLDVRLDDDQWLRATVTSSKGAPSMPVGFVTHLSLTLVAVIIVSVIAVRLATRPLLEMAEAADAFGADLDAPRLKEAGTTETRRAARAFNGMQEKLKRLIAERSMALAAVSHDLRTPLTRMRLRVELMEDEKLRDQVVADIDEMQSMIDTTLEYLRTLRESEAPRPIDMNALLQSMAEDESALGRAVTVVGRAAAPYAGRLAALKRAVSNLIDNAVKYGGSATLRLEDSPGQLKVIVEDGGPGIPQAELARVTQPYYRLESSRSRETGGVGLGLAIVRDIALLHGGDLLLANRDGGGLSATLALPRRAG